MLYGMEWKWKKYAAKTLTVVPLFGYNKVQKKVSTIQFGFLQAQQDIDENCKKKN